MTKIISWIVKSSVDSSRLSLTVKGFLVGTFSVFGTVLIALGFNGLPSTEVNLFIENITQTIAALGTVIGALVTAFGALRKIYLTVTAPKI
jgi:hypothetical protein